MASQTEPEGDNKEVETPVTMPTIAEDSDDGDESDYLVAVLSRITTGVHELKRTGHPYRLPGELAACFAGPVVAACHQACRSYLFDANDKRFGFTHLSVQSFASAMLSTTGYFYSSRELGYLRGKFPYLRGALHNYSGASSHSHAVAAFERNVAEQACYRLLTSLTDTGCFIDVGGNSNRHNIYGRDRVWTCKPLLFSQDNERQRFSRSGCWCDHRVEDCTCVQPAGYMFVHSLYYFTPDELLLLLMRTGEGIMAAAVHRFKEGAGLLASGQLVYRRVGAEVTMTATGNSFSYTHDDCAWLDRGYHTNGTHAMSWTVRHEIGDTLVYCFLACPIRALYVEPLSITLEKAISSDDYFGQTIDCEKELKIGSRALSAYKVPIRHVRRMRGVFYVDGPKTKDISVPLPLVREASRYMVGKPRNAVTWASLNSKLRTVCSQDHIDNPLVEIDKACMYAAALGFMANLKEETSLLLYINRRIPRLALHEKLLNFEQVKLWRYRWWASAAIASSLLFVIVLCVSMVSSQFSWLGLLALIPFFFLPSNPSLGSWVTAVQNQYTRYQLSSSFSKDVVLHEQFKVVLHQLEEPPPIPGTLTVRDLEVNDSPVGQALHAGLAFSQCMPLYFSRSKNNLLTSLALRVAPKEDGDTYAAAWARLSENSLPLIFTTLQEPAERKKISVLKWASRYPPAITTLYMNTHAALQGRELTKYDCQRKGFIKVEARPALTDYVVEVKIPRLIQAAKPEFNVTCGPELYSVGEHLKENWNGVTSRIFYPSGSDAFRIGAWFHTNYSPGDVMLDNDAKTFDASVTIPVLEAEMKWLEYEQVNQRARNAVRLSWQTEGYTKHWKYRIKGGRKSGDQHTSSGNTFLNVAMHLHCFTLIVQKHTGWPWRAAFHQTLTHVRIIALGDDIFVIFKPPVAFIQDYKSELIRLMTTLGFAVKPVFSKLLHEVGFCSGLFMPCIVERVPSYILTPKPGRLMYKLGFTDPCGRPVDVKAHMRGVALGLSPICSWHPILGPYIKMLLRVTMGSPVIALGSYKYDIYKLNGHHVVADHRSFEFLDLRYGWDHYKAWQNLLDKVTQLPAITPTSITNTLFQVDLA